MLPRRGRSGGVAGRRRAVAQPPHPLLELEGTMGGEEEGWSSMWPDNGVETRQEEDGRGGGVGQGGSRLDEGDGDKVGLALLDLAEDGTTARRPHHPRPLSL